MKTMGRIAEVNGYKLKDDWYQSCVVCSPEEAVRALHEAWGSADRHRGLECPRCKGRGYTRKDKNVGCHVCHGLGVLDASNG